jgi:2',3'-cyclic-nucleotide 2'-phosphodiesterase (5'-nucleotidase family)
MPPFRYEACAAQRPSAAPLVPRENPVCLAYGALWCKTCYSPAAMIPQVSKSRAISRRWLVVVLAAAWFAGALFACSGAPRARHTVPSGTSRSDQGARAAQPMTISVVGTNDVHGRIASLPWLGGYVRNLRQARERDGGAVLLIDGGDMFQGTLESNLVKGASVIEAYNTLGYTAAAIGNHEFDFGPVGPPILADAGEDARGALKARAAEARFPLLTANVMLSDRSGLFSAPNIVASHLMDVRGVKVGILGITTEQTPYATIAANFEGLSIRPLAEAVHDEATRLRSAGAQVLIVAAHAGGKCESFESPDDLTSCDAEQEIFAVARALPAGDVHVIVAGHTHAKVAHRVNGIAIIEAGAFGEAFGRVDLHLDGDPPRVIDTRLYAPQQLCPGGEAPSSEETAAVCRPGNYEGAPVSPDRRVHAVIQRYLDEARSIRVRPIAATVAATLGNLFADVIRELTPGADLAIMNGRGIRNELPAGPLFYGELYETMPFENRFATFSMRADHLKKAIGRQLMEDRGGFLAISGVRAFAECEGGGLQVTLERANGRRIRDAEVLRVATNDFVATGGSGILADLSFVEDPRLDREGPMVRDAAATLIARRGVISPTDPRLFDPQRPRVVYPGSLPVTCP